MQSSKLQLARKSMVIELSAGLAAIEIEDSASVRMARRC